MEKFIIQGGVPLSGEIVPAGNKNAALPILAACLLTDEELVVRNVPRIRDVESMLGLLEGLGVKVAWTGENEVRLQADDHRGTEVDEELANRIRASFLVAGPLLARFGEVKMPPPGGDTIGRRRLDAHLDAFRDLGAKIDGDVWIELSAPPDGPEADPDLHGRALGDGNRERAARRGPDARARRRSPTPPASPTSRTWPGCSARWARRSTGIGSNVMTVHGQREARRRRARRRARPHRDRQLHGARRRHQRRAAHPRHRRRGPGGHPPPLPAHRPADDDRGRRPAGPAGAEADDPRRPGRRDPEDRRRPLAGLPGRPHLDRAGARHPGRRGRS